MTANRKRKQAARAYQAEHGVDYTTARRATELSPPQGRRRRAAATLAVAPRDILAGLLRSQNRPPLRERGARGLVEAMLNKLDGLPHQEDPLDGGLWSCVMAGGWGTVGPVESVGVRKAADFITALVAELDDATLVAAATDLSVRERDVAYIARKAYTKADGGAGRPREVDAIISRQPGAGDEMMAQATQIQAKVEEHLRDLSADTWDDGDRIVLRQAALQEIASIGDAYLSASDDLDMAALAWRRLPDGSMRADVAGDDGSSPVSVLVKATETSPIPDVDDFTEFYPTNRPQRAVSYMCHVGAFREGAAESDVSPPAFEELYSSGPHTQLDGQRTGTEVLAEVLADM
ncbi:MAG: hypothetical protein JHC70_03230 [Rhodococcus sp.]|uniref:hypothetical protein n=1 Tax=Rhodococcus erythropolis TaxID=1833 RepID=UPI001A30EE1A|nr:MULTISPECIES: hypothetical protein [Rhodococcus]MBJ7321340.1 hypothetical protein [Rhodococcus sp. (in: high G+C Gram-positive bacteria)]MBY6388809.1 hypothetical protein [Rhodococcus erythropolis]